MLSINPGSRRLSTCALSLLVASVPLVMGAKWTEKPIEDIQQVVGTWSGGGTGAQGTPFSVKFIITEDRFIQILDVVWMQGTASGKAPLRLNGGKLWYKSITNDQNIVHTLYESHKGKQKLEGRREDGASWQVTRVKKKK